MAMLLRAALVVFMASTGARATPCAQPWTMLESAETRAEHFHGSATMVQGAIALRIADAINHTGEPTHYYGDSLIIWSEPDNNKAIFVFVKDGCGTGESAEFSIKAFAGVLAKAYPRRGR